MRTSKNKQVSIAVRHNNYSYTNTSTTNEYGTKAGTQSTTHKHHPPTCNGTTHGHSHGRQLIVPQRRGSETQSPGSPASVPPPSLELPVPTTRRATRGGQSTRCRQSQGASAGKRRIGGERGSCGVDARVRGMTTRREKGGTRVFLPTLQHRQATGLHCAAPGAGYNMRALGEVAEGHFLVRRQHPAAALLHHPVGDVPQQRRLFLIAAQSREANDRL